MKTAIFTSLVFLASCSSSLEGLELSQPEGADMNWSAESTDLESGDTELVPFSPSKEIRYGRRCKECDFNISKGLACTIPAKKTCGSDFSVGSGFCTARPADKKGYCSARCKSADDCKSGYSCSDLGTGAGKVCVK